MALATGCFYTVVLNEDGRLFSSGNNSNGCLLQGTRVHERRFVSIARKNTRFAAIKAGLQHWLALDEDGRLWGCGSNFHGQLGLGQETLETLCLSLVPLLTLGGQRVHSLSVGLAHSIICTSSCRIFATGCNTEGQLGTGDFTRRSEFVAVHGGSDAKLQCRASLGPCSLAAGGWHSLAIDPEGNVWTWGSLIGTPPTSLPDGNVGRAQAPVPGRFHPETFELEKVCAVSAGHCHAIAITRSAVFSWGDGSKGCLGQGHWESLALPTKIDTFTGCVLTSVACGPYHNIATHASGRAFAWGNNNRGQLGLGDLVDRSTPAPLPVHTVHHQRIMEVSAGVEHCGAISEGGVLYTWGRCKTNGVRSFSGPRDSRKSITCGLGVASGSYTLPNPVRVTALFEKGPPSGARTSRLGRWHGISTAHAVAWLMGAHRRLGSTSSLSVSAHSVPAPDARRSARIARRAEQGRPCWVFALPPDVVQCILDQCRGRHGWFCRT